MQLVQTWLLKKKDSLKGTTKRQDRHAKDTERACALSLRMEKSAGCLLSESHRGHFANDYSGRAGCMAPGFLDLLDEFSRFL